MQITCWTFICMLRRQNLMSGSFSTDKVIWCFICVILRSAYYQTTWLSFFFNVIKLRHSTGSHFYARARVIASSSNVLCVVRFAEGKFVDWQIETVIRHECQMIFQEDAQENHWSDSDDQACKWSLRNQPVCRLKFIAELEQKKDIFEKGLSCCHDYIWRWMKTTGGAFESPEHDLQNELRLITVWWDLTHEHHIAMILETDWKITHTDCL